MVLRLLVLSSGGAVDDGFGCGEGVVKVEEDHRRYHSWLPLPWRPQQGESKKEKSTSAVAIVSQ